MEVNVWEDQSLNLGNRVTKKETYGDFVKRVIQWRKELEKDSDSLEDGKRMQTLVFTHSMVISEFLNTLVSESRGVLSDEWAKVYWQVNHGSVTCVDYMNNGEWHIHAMNYTKHITHYTGLKSPLV
jgi:broad specificity phosphatase PhoE